MRVRSSRIPVLSPRIPPFLALLALALIAMSACSSVGASSATSSDSSSASGGSGGSSQLALTGAITGTVSTDGTCGTTADGSFQSVWSPTVNGKLYLFQIVLAPYKGAGSYTTDQTAASTAIDLTSQAGDGDWHSQYSTQSSTIVLNADLTSGTVNGILATGNGAPASTVTVSGTWHCSKG